MIKIINQIMVRLFFLYKRLRIVIQTEYKVLVIYAAMFTCRCKSLNHCFNYIHINSMIYFSLKHIFIKYAQDILSGNTCANILLKVCNFFFLIPTSRSTLLISFSTKIENESDKFDFFQLWYFLCRFILATWIEY